MLSPWPRHANTSHSGVYAFSFFLPIILRQGLGYSLELSFVLTAFPPCFAVIVVMTVSWLADKYRVRGLPVIGQGLLGIVGLCMTGFLDTPVPRYVGTFLGYAGAVGLVVTSMSWMANNLRGDGKRAVATAIMISISGVGGIYSSLVFRQQVRYDILFSHGEAYTDCGFE
jgi:4-amino-4-deoxy-L-arabinose transferase-like glycosyltransferase